MEIESCPHCGGETVAERTLCRHCGRRVRDFAECPNCKEPVANGASHCPFCTSTIPTPGELAAKDLSFEIEASRFGSAITGGSITSLFFPPIISVSDGRFRVTRWSFFGLRTHQKELQVSRVASVHYTKGVIWGGLLIETFGGAAEDLAEYGLYQDDARNMAEQLKAVLTDGF